MHFSEKADSVILLGFECTINPLNLIKIVGAIFQKIEKLISFLCELPLILSGAMGEISNFYNLSPSFFFILCTHIPLILATYTSKFR